MSTDESGLATGLSRAGGLGRSWQDLAGDRLLRRDSNSVYSVARILCSRRNWPDEEGNKTFLLLIFAYLVEIQHRFS